MRRVRWGGAATSCHWQIISYEVTWASGGPGESGPRGRNADRRATMPVKSGSGSDRQTNARAWERASGSVQTLAGVLSTETPPVANDSPEANDVELLRQAAE